ncbi:MAG: EF-hand domain-containing protein [Campylobacterota bacterium]|nr:EF-hand domain-containing protein [Campylobacterota bacterium]
MKNPIKEIAVSAMVAILVGAIPVLVQAEELPDRGPVPFSAYDKNGDNSISEEEFYGVRAQRMEKRAQEGRPMRRAANAPDFSEFDSNGDGELTSAELTAGQQAQMQQRRGGKGMGKGQGVK